MIGNCPECQGDVPFGEVPETGEVVICPDCGVDLEITSIAPAMLALAPQEAEDWGE